MKYGRDLVENDIVWSCCIDWGQKEDPVTLAALRESAYPGVVISLHEGKQHDQVGLCVTGNCAKQTKNDYGGQDMSCWCFGIIQDTKYPESPDEAMEESISVEEKYGKAIQEETSRVRIEMKGSL